MEPPFEIADYLESVYRVCRRYTQMDADAWDAVQETFVAYLLRAAQLDRTTDLGPWLRETARRCCYAVNRASQRQQTVAVIAIPTTSDSLFDRYSRQEIREIVSEEFAALPASDREILQLWLVDGQKHQDIARELKCPRGSVHFRTRMAQAHLKTRLRHRGVR